MKTFGGLLHLESGAQHRYRSPNELHEIDYMSITAVSIDSPRGSQWVGVLLSVPEPGWKSFETPVYVVFGRKAHRLSTVMSDS